MPRVLFVGESWSTVSFNLKGFSIYTAGEYEEGGTPLIDALASEGHEVDYLRSHEVATRYPRSVDELSAYDTVVFSDVGADTFLLRPDTLRRSLVMNNPLADVCAHV